MNSFKLSMNIKRQFLITTLLLSSCFAFLLNSFVFTQCKNLDFTISPCGLLSIIHIIYTSVLFLPLTIGRTFTSEPQPLDRLMEKDILIYSYSLIIYLISFIISWILLYFGYFRKKLVKK